MNIRVTLDNMQTYHYENVRKVSETKINNLIIYFNDGTKIKFSADEWVSWGENNA